MTLYEKYSYPVTYIDDARESPALEIMDITMHKGGLVTKDIPDYELWFGNPAKFIRKI